MSMTPGGAGGWAGEHFSTSHGLQVAWSHTADRKLLGKIWDILRYYKFTEVQAAGIMGNMRAESNFRSSAIESTGVGFGLVQWSYGRRPAVEHFCSAKGVSISDVPVQIEFLSQECHGNGQVGSNLRKLGWVGVSTAFQASKIFMLGYEVNSTSWSTFNHYQGTFLFDEVRAPVAKTIYGWFKGSKVPGAVVEKLPANYTGAVVAGTHKWKTHTNVGVFGLDDTKPEKVTGNYPDTETMNANELFYFSNQNMAYGTRLIFRCRAKCCIGVCVDNRKVTITQHTGASGMVTPVTIIHGVTRSRNSLIEQRTMDIGHPIAEYFGFTGYGNLEWDYVNTTDRGALRVVPEVRGLPLESAKQRLTTLGFKVKESSTDNPKVREGIISSQSPAAESGVVKGTTVTIVQSTGKKASPVTVAAAHPATATLPDKLEFPSSSHQLVIITSSSASDPDGTLELYNKNNNGSWSKQMSVTVRAGKKAFTSGTSRHQGSNTTPTGTWWLPNWAFGKSGYKPSGLKLKWRNLTNGVYWSSEQGSEYNTWVNHSASGEHLINYANESYKYAINSGYNSLPNNRVYGRGTAIFIHCMHSGYTAGCISISESHMVELLKKLDPAKKPLCIIGTTNYGHSTSLPWK